MPERRAVTHPPSLSPFGFCLASASNLWATPGSPLPTRAPSRRHPVCLGSGSPNSPSRAAVSPGSQQWPAGEGGGPAGVTSVTQGFWTWPSLRCPPFPISHPQACFLGLFSVPGAGGGSEVGTDASSGFLPSKTPSGWGGRPRN